MKTVTLGFSHCNTIYSKLIRAATRSDISHCYIVKDVDVAGRVDKAVYHADGANVHVVDYDTFRTENVVVSEITLEVADADYVIGEAKLYDALGKPYSYREIVGFGWVLLMRKFGKTVRNPMSDGSSGFFCSALVMQYLGQPDHIAECATPYDAYKAAVARVTTAKILDAMFATTKTPKGLSFTSEE